MIRVNHSSEDGRWHGISDVSQQASLSTASVMVACHSKQRCLRAQLGTPDWFDNVTFQTNVDAGSTSQGGGGQAIADAWWVHIKCTTIGQKYRKTVDMIIIINNIHRFPLSPREVWPPPHVSDGMELLYLSCATTNEPFYLMVGFPSVSGCPHYTSLHFSIHSRV